MTKYNQKKTVICCNYNQKLGKGCNASVYRAKYFKRQCAVKVLDNHAKDKVFIETACVGVDNIQAVKQDCSNIVPILAQVDVKFKSDGENSQLETALVMPMFSGTLEELRETRVDRGFTAAEIRNLAKQLFQALYWCHCTENRIAHRDVTSKNILINALSDTSWLLALTDFGSAIKADSPSPHFLHLVSSCDAPNFMQQAIETGFQSGCAKDMADCGAVLYHLIDDRPWDNHHQYIDHAFVMDNLSIWRSAMEKQLLALQWNENDRQQFINLLHRLLRFDPLNRITSTQALQHPFILQ